jgi:hypothetical protein
MLEVSSLSFVFAFAGACNKWALYIEEVVPHNVEKPRQLQ